MDEDVKIPSDVQISLWAIEQEHLVQQYDTLRFLAVKHEQELALLSLTVLLLGAVVALDTYLTWKERDGS